MSRPCTVCTHPQRDDVDSALVARVPFRHIAAQYAISTGALQRHRRDHLPTHLARSQEARELASADAILAEVRGLHGKALGILAEAERVGDGRLALTAIREARGTLELLARLIGELDERPRVNVLVAPAWLAVRAVV